MFDDVGVICTQQSRLQVLTLARSPCYMITTTEEAAAVNPLHPNTVFCTSVVSDADAVDNVTLPV